MIWVIRRSVPDMVDDMVTQGIYTDEKMVQKMLQVIHELEPSGVGARFTRMLAVTIETQNTHRICRTSH
jgi:DNA-directed RNA polymerase specialized sigma54-like protein